MCTYYLFCYFSGHDRDLDDDRVHLNSGPNTHTDIYNRKEHNDYEEMVSEEELESFFADERPPALCYAPTTAEVYDRLNFWEDAGDETVHLAPEQML